MRQRASTPCLPQTGGRRSGSQASTPCLPQTGGYSVSIRLLGLSLARFRAFRVQRQCPASGSGVRVRAFASCASQPRCPGGLIGFAHSPPAPDKPGGSSAPPRPYQPRRRGGLISPAAVAALSAPPAAHQAPALRLSNFRMSAARGASKAPIFWPARQAPIFWPARGPDRGQGTRWSYAVLLTVALELCRPFNRRVGAMPSF